MLFRSVHEFFYFFFYSEIAAHDQSKTTRRSNQSAGSLNEALANSGQCFKYPERCSFLGGPSVFGLILHLNFTS